jgi:hypothetical protein
MASALDVALNSQNPTGRFHSKAVGDIIGWWEIEHGYSGLFGFCSSRHRISQGLVIPQSGHLA